LGADEHSVDGVDAQAAVRFLDRLVVEGPIGEATECESGAPVPLSSAADLAVPDRDRLLAETYRRIYGCKVATTVSCRDCGSPYDMDFDLPAFVDSLRADSDEDFRTESIGIYRTHQGTEFRLPTAWDEMAVRALADEKRVSALLERCRMNGPCEDNDTLEATMEAVAPVLDRSINVQCPECGAEQGVRFDIQEYLLTALEQDKPTLLWEVHLIASAYGWSRGEILSLARGERRQYVDLIESEAGVAA